MTNEEWMSKTIKFMRFPLAVLVVMEHFTLANNGFTLHGVTYGLNQPDWYVFFINFIGITLASVNVPLFLVFSGFFFFYRKEFSQQVYKDQLRKRVHTLLIPFILWNVLAILMIAVRFLPIFSSVLPGMDEIKFNPTLSGLFYTFFDNFHQKGLFIYPDASWRPTVLPINGPTWFLRDLMVMAIASPLLYWLIKKLKGWAVVLIWVTDYFIYPYFFDGGYFGMLLGTAFFFSWGAYYSIHGKNIVMEMRQLKWVAYAYIPLAIAATVADGELGVMLNRLAMIFGIITDIIVASWLVEKGKVHIPKLLTDSTFFIYALHMLFMWELGKVVFSILHIGNNTYGLIAFYFGIVFLTIVISVGIYAFTRRYLPTLCKLLTGGR